MADNSKATSKDVLAAIFKRHTGPEWCNFAEVADDTGIRSRRRADAICMNIWPSKGYAIHGFEIKVSRSDFLNEMKDITKAKAVAQYCDFWWLAVPCGLVSADEVPATWGLMELHANGLKIKKQAQQAEAPTPISRGFMASLMRKSRDSDEPYIQHQVSERVDAEVKRMEREAEMRRGRLERDVEHQREWIAKFEAKLGRDFATWEAPEAMAERMRVAERLEFNHVSRVMQTAAAFVHDIGELGKAMKEGRDGNDHA